MKTKILCGLMIGTLALAGAAMGQGSVIAYDEAGNYTPATFSNGANEGFGFNAWNLWNVPADLGDSTAGGGGDLNSTNGYSFRFMGDGAGNWCNGERQFEALQEDDILSFTFTYNWDGGGRGVDMYCATGQFANLIDVTGGNTFKVNGETLSTEWSPGAVVDVEITQLADGIQLHITRTTNGTENLNYTTNILNPEPATGVSMYCGGYTCDPADNVNYAIFMNDLQIFGADRIGLEFISGTWDPALPGPYEFVLERTGAVSNDIVLTSSNTNAVTVPDAVSFTEGSNSVSFNVTVVSLTEGPATIVASNEATGVWTDYVITPVAPTLAIGGPWELFIVPQPVQYTLTRTGAVGDNVSLTSSDPSVLAVPPAAAFAAGATETTFTATSMAYGVATILASNAAAQATFDVTVSEPAITIEGPATVWTGGTMYYTLRRNTPTGIGHIVNLTSSNTNRLTVPDTVYFDINGSVLYFAATGVAPGEVTLTADNDDVEPAVFSATVADPSGVLAQDAAGNYIPETFTNGANEGTGFGAWNLWGTLAELGDSTAGGGGDINSGNGYSFRFMGDGAGGWCNGERPFAALQPGDVLSFTFTYNWDGGGRGVDIFSAGGQFANLIDVSPGDTFKVNGQTISTNYSPGAVVEVEITQQADGIQLYLTRTVEGAVNLAYVTNIVHGEAATGVSMYCGGYADVPENNVNYAIFMNDLQIAGDERMSLVFSQATWNPSAAGDYPFELTREGPVGDDLVLTSDNEAAVTVTNAVQFDEGLDAVSFVVTVLSLTNGDATITASNAETGVWAEYTVRPQLPTLAFTAGTWDPTATGEYEFELTRGGSTVDDDIVLTSDNEAAVTVPAGVSFDPGSGTVRFNITVVSLTNGNATVVASNIASGAWADYTIQPSVPVIGPDFGEDIQVNGEGNLEFTLPAGYQLNHVYGADCALDAGDWDWQELVQDTDYTVDGSTVTIITAGRKILRIGMIPD